MKSIPLTENELNHIKETYALELERLQKRTNEISSILKKLQGKNIEDNQLVEEVSPKTQSKVTQKPGRKATPKKETIKKAVSQPAKVDEKPKGKRGRPAKIKPETKVVATKKEVAIAKDVKAAVVKGKPGRKPSVKEVIETKPRSTKKTKEVIKAIKPKKTETKPLKVKKIVVAVKKAVTPAKRGRKQSDSSKKSSWTALILDILKNKGKVLPSREIIEQIMKIQHIPAADLRKTRSIITGSLSDLKLETKKIKSISVPGQKGELYGLPQWFNELGQLVDPSKL